MSVVEGTGTDVTGRGDLVSRAAAYAAEVHAGDRRKGRDIPYFEGHLEPVAEIVRGAGGDPVQIAAAYLHDTAEDHGGAQRLADVRQHFGDDVADIVRDLSDSLVDVEAGEEKAPWRERKESYVAALATSSTISLEVAAADKLHNARSMLDDFRELGAGLWSRFSVRDPESQLWYYESLAERISAGLPGGHPTASELRRVVAELAATVRATA